jgi:hypothetical protein
MCCRDGHVILYTKKCVLANPTQPLCTNVIGYERNISAIKCQELCWDPHLIFDYSTLSWGWIPRIIVVACGSPKPPNPFIVNSRSPHFTHWDAIIKEHKDDAFKKVEITKSLPPKRWRGNDNDFTGRWFLKCWWNHPFLSFSFFFSFLNVIFDAWGGLWDKEQLK